MMEPSLRPPARLDSPLPPGFDLGILFPARPFKFLLIGVKDAGALPLDFIDRISGHCGHALIHPPQDTVMDDPHTNGGRLQDASQQGLVLPQGLLDPFELADIRDGARGADDPAVSNRRP